jgi:hypothetical protein
MIVGGLVLALGAPAHAQNYPTCDRQPTSDDIEGAKGAHKAAQRFYDKGQYEDAVRSWVDAYKFDCTAHPLLINIGNAYEKLGERQKAIDAFETYLQRMKEGADPTIPDKVANLKDQLLRERMRTASTATATATAPPPPANPPPPSDAGASSGPGAWPWVLTGLGAAILVAGVPVTVVGQGKIADAKDQCGGTTGCASDVAKSGNTGRTLTGVGIGMFVVGALTAGGGLVWYAVASGGSENAGKPAAASLSFEPWLSPWTSGLSLSGRF